MTLADAFKPGVKRFVMELDRMVSSRLKLIRIEVLDDALLPSCTNGLLASLTTCEHLDMHHVMLLLPTLRVEVDATIEDQVTRLHLLKLEINRQCIILICLVPSI